MNSSPLRLVLCDIDSTLINDQRQLTSRTKTMIDQLHMRGVEFGLASGRPVDELKRYAPFWGFDFPFEVLIGMNGSELWDEKAQKQYDFYKLKKEWIKEILEAMKPFPSNAFIYRDGKLMVQRVDAMTKKSSVTSQKPIVKIKDDAELYEVDNAKIMFRMSSEQTLKVEEYFEKHPHPHYKAFKTQSTLIEFAHRNISKAYALEKICEHRDYSLENVWSFGDTTNDNAMLQVSGRGICMLNGTEDTKAIADAITEFDNNQDGVAIYIENEFLRSGSV